MPGVRGFVSALVSTASIGTFGVSSESTGLVFGGASSPRLGENNRPTPSGNGSIG